MVHRQLFYPSCGKEFAAEELPCNSEDFGDKDYYTQWPFKRWLAKDTDLWETWEPTEKVKD